MASYTSPNEECEMEDLTTSLAIRVLPHLKDERHHEISFRHLHGCSFEQAIENANVTKKRKEMIEKIALEKEEHGMNSIGALFASIAEADLYWTFIFRQQNVGVFNEIYYHSDQFKEDYLQFMSQLTAGIQK